MVSGTSNDDELQVGTWCNCKLPRSWWQCQYTTCANETPIQLVKVVKQSLHRRGMQTTGIINTCVDALLVAHLRNNWKQLERACVACLQWSCITWSTESFARIHKSYAAGPDCQSRAWGPNPRSCRVGLAYLSYWSDPRQKEEKYTTKCRQNNILEFQRSWSNCERMHVYSTTCVVQRKERLRQHSPGYAAWPRYLHIGWDTHKCRGEQ